MKKFICIGLFFNAAIIFSQDKMVRHQINEEISYEVPSSFVLMSSGVRKQKYVSAREPLAMHSSMDREVDLGVNWNQMQWMDGEEETIYGFYKASIQSMFDEVEFIQDEIKEVNGKKFIVFEFISSLKSENAFSETKSSRNYTYIQYTSYNNQVLLFNFGCKARLMNQWQPVAAEIMNSVKVKEQ
ncbi:hypothetical protein [Ekhidna sp.]|uniref:hypothetical protein n=1 Tax=Ekhidna sp. TaxID=2608089 RepID=UPI0035148D6C